MDFAIEDVLFQWALYHHPALLYEEELFDGLVKFIHAVLAAAVREERAAALRRVLTSSPS